MLYLPCAALLATVASAALTPDMQKNEHLQLDFSVLRGNSRLTAVKGAHAAFVSKNNYTELALDNGFSYYSATLKVGSKGDQNTVIVDTGSSDLWFMSSDVACYGRKTSKRSTEEFTPLARHRVFEIDPQNPPKAQKLEKRASQAASQSTSHVASATTTSIGPVDAATCTSMGSFSTKDSSSFHVNASAPMFSISYGDGSYAEGVWGTDSVSVGALNISRCNFAVVNQSMSVSGVFGIGLPGLESTYATSGSRAYKYQNFPLRLKNTGLIKKNAYSLYLNDYSTSSGSVLFGAVDHAKYSGQLQTVPLVNVYPDYFIRPITFDVALDSITVESSSQNITVVSTPFHALLDSGTTLTYLPNAVVESLASSLNAKYSKSGGVYEVNCELNTSSINVVYNFSGIEIRVPLSDLIMSSAILKEKTSKCYLGVLPSDGSSSQSSPAAILGDNFLRHAYVVYDLEDYEVSMAQVMYSNDTNIEIISSTIPSAVKAPSYSATSLATYISQQPTSSHLSTSTPKNSEGSRVIHFAKSAIMAVVGVSLLLIL